MGKILVQDIREYELDYEAAKKAAAEAASLAEKEEERTIKLLERNPLGEEMNVEEVEDLNFGERPVLQILDSFVPGTIPYVFLSRRKSSGLGSPLCNPPQCTLAYLGYCSCTVVSMHL